MEERLGERSELLLRFGSERPLVQPDRVRHVGRVSVVYVVEVASTLLLFDMIFFLELLNKQVLWVLLVKELREEVGREAAVELVLPLGHQAVAHVSCLIACLFLLKPMINS